VTQENGGWVGSVSAVWGSKPSTNLNIAIVVVAVVAAAAVAGVDGAVGAVVVVAVVGDVFFAVVLVLVYPISRHTQI